MAASSSWATPQLKNYHVFLSFRGEDTRNNFTAHLYADLCRKKIETFMDDQLIRGDEISSSLLNTIKASKISVIIFSQNYATSRWCLQELEQILDCKETKQQIVIPIFHKVDPSHVRHQEKSFGKGFAELQDRFKKRPGTLQRWKSALTKAAGLSGWTVDANTFEPKCINEISDAILERLNKLSPSDYKGLVGVEFSINKIESLLHKGSNGVSRIGIWGIGGVGKTTIAHVVFNKILSRFEGSYFAENIREELEKDNSLTHMRNKLLSTILEDRDPNIGLTFTRQRLEGKKVLIVFDDVTSSQQIENLIENLNLLSSTSQVIITTRDKQVLRNCDVDDAYIYKVEGLKENEAHQLFNQYAFRQYIPTADFMELSKKAVAYTKCLPLALKVLGSSLFSKKKDFWESAIERLEKGPPSDIHKVLKVSYDCLETEEKVIFLDIACFFKGDHIDSLIENLNACDISTRQGIEVLIDKCLVSVTYGNKITMHDLLQEMGRKIDRDGTCKHRLWHHKDIFKAFENKMGVEAEAVRSIKLDVSKISNRGLNCHNLSKMNNLRFFEVYNSEDQNNYENKLNGFEELESFSKDITFFHWNNYPFESLPLSFSSENLVRLDMPHNKVKHWWNSVQNLLNLKYVDLSYSYHMTEIPNLSRASNLQTLNLKGCDSLLEITLSSIQNLNKLVQLDLLCCKRLIRLPDGIQSKSIRLAGCSNLKIAPKISCQVEELDLEHTAIKESPSIEHPSRLVTLNFRNCFSLESLSSSIYKLKDLKYLFLDGCSKLERFPLSILDLPNLNSLHVSKDIDKAPLNCVRNSSPGFSSLEILRLDRCQITKLPDNLGQLSFLKALYLSRNNFESIPENIKELSKLELLDISDCRRLQLLPELPMGVSVLASDCSSLQSISDLSSLLLPHWRSRRISFANCFEFDLLKILHEEFCREICANICFPGNEIPKWFTSQNTGSCVTLDRSLDWHNKNLLGFLISVVVCPKVCISVDDWWYAICYCSVKGKDGKEQIYSSDVEFWNNFDEIDDTYDGTHFEFDDDESCYETYILSSCFLKSSHVYLNFHPITKNAFIECNDERYHEVSSEMKSSNCKVLLKFEDPCGEVKKCGIHLLYVEDYGEPLETSRRNVDNDKKNGKEKEKEKDELQFNKLQIANSFDGICDLRPRFMSMFPRYLDCLEARYWKLRRNALREIVKNALQNFQQNTVLCSEVEEMNCVNPKGCLSFPGSDIPEWFSFQNASYYIELPRTSFHDRKFVGLTFCTVVEFPNLLDLGQRFFVNFELHFEKYDGSFETVAIGSIQGSFEGDRTHYIKSDHVFLGYDCVMYIQGAFDIEDFNVCQNYSSDKAIIKFSVTNCDGVVIEGCKVKKCGVRLLCPQDFENKWKNPIDLSSLKRRLKLKGNGHCNDEPPSYGLSAARDWQPRSSATSLDLNELVGSTTIDTTEPQSKRSATSLDLIELVGSTTIDTTEPQSKRLKLEK